MPIYHQFPKMKNLKVIGLSGLISLKNKMENSDGADTPEELAEAASSSQDRRRSGTVIPPERNVRPRTATCMMRASRKAREDLLFRTPGVNPQPWKADLMRRNRNPGSSRWPRAWPNPYMTA